MYERFGFRTVGTYEVRRIVYVESFMVRAPRGVKGGGGGGGGGGMMEKVGR